MSRNVASIAVTGMALLVAGCSDGVKENIRQHDFRTVRAERRQQQLAAAPSPISNVADMPGWTTDLQGATAFARENGQKTLVFMQDGNAGGSQKMKTALNSSDMSKIGDRVQKVTFDQRLSPELAAQYSASGPAVLVLDPSGSIVARQDGAVNKSTLLASLP